MATAYRPTPQCYMCNSVFTHCRASPTCSRYAFFPPFSPLFFLTNPILLACSRSERPRSCCTLLSCEGQHELVAGNSFGGTAFSMFGGFWLSYGFILQPGTGVLDAYKDDTVSLHNATGCFLVVWSLFAWIMTIAALRTNAGLLLVFITTSLSLPLLAAGAFSGVGVDSGLTQAGGIVGMASALFAFYTAAAGLLTAKTSYFTRASTTLTRQSALARCSRLAQSMCRPPCPRVRTLHCRMLQCRTRNCRN